MLSMNEMQKVHNRRRFHLLLILVLCSGQTGKADIGINE